MRILSMRECALYYEIGLFHQEVYLAATLYYEIRFTKKYI